MFSSPGPGIWEESSKVANDRVAKITKTMLQFSGRTFGVLNNYGN